MPYFPELWDCPAPPPRLTPSDSRLEKGTLTAYLILDGGSGSPHGSRRTGRPASRGSVLHYCLQSSGLYVGGRNDVVGKNANSFDLHVDRVTHLDGPDTRWRAGHDEVAWEQRHVLA